MNGVAILDMPSYMEDDESATEPLTSEIVSPTHPITARADIIRAAKIGAIRKKLLKQDEATPAQRQAFWIASLIILSVAVIVTAKVLDHRGPRIWLLVFWLALLAVMALCYALIFV